MGHFKWLNTLEYFGLIWKDIKWTIFVILLLQNFLTQVTVRQMTFTSDSLERHLLRVCQAVLLVYLQSQFRYKILFCSWCWSDKSNLSVSFYDDCFLVFSVTACVDEDGSVGCFLFVQGMGGAVQYPRNYLKEAYQLVRERGGLCIADEVSHTKYQVLRTWSEPV